MICPRCGERAAPGADRCANCGTPFTRRSSARATGRGAAASPSPLPQATSYRTYQRGSGVGRAVVAWLAVLFLAAVAILALIAVFSSTVIKPYVGNQIEQALRVPSATSVPASSSAAAPAATETAIPASQSPNQAVITDQDLNDAIAQHQDQLGVLDSVQVQIETNQLAVVMKSHGVSGTYHGQVAVQNGKPVLTNGHIDGLLGYVIPTSQLEDVLNQQIDAAVAQSGVSVQSITLQPGKMIVGYA